MSHPPDICLQHSISACDICWGARQASAGWTINMARIPNNSTDCMRLPTFLSYSVLESLDKCTATKPSVSKKNESVTMLP